MLLNLYCVFDVKSGVYDRPFCAVADGAAVRSFSDICVNAEHPIGQHPEDYSLYWLGAFNDNDASLSISDKKCLITGLEAVSAGRVIEPGSLKEVV